MNNKKGIRILLAAFLISGLLIGCSVGGSEQRSDFDAEIDQKIQEVVHNGELPSVQIAVIDQGQIIALKTYGADTGTHFVYMNGSVQKIVDATAILQLHEKENINLDADVSEYLPFQIRHPEYPEIPITARMLLSHRSGLDEVPDQFSWDTECLFVQYRPDCNFETKNLSLEDYLIASFISGGSNFNPGMWVYKPGEKYHYSVSAYPLLRYLIERISGLSFPAYMTAHIFEPLEMVDSGFVSGDFIDQHAVPFTRVAGENIELPVWNGNGYMMRTTAQDMAKFMLAHMHDGSYNGFQLLQPETIKLMRTKESKGKSILNPGSELTDAGYGLGLIHYNNGWIGHGGSTVGYQSLWQFNPSKQCGFVIFTNANGILGGRDDAMSVWESVEEIQHILLKHLDPLSVIRSFPRGLIVLWAVVIIFGTLIVRRSRRKRGRP